MEKATPESSMINPWADRAQLPKTKPVYTLLAALMLFVCAIGLPLCQYREAAAVLFAVLFGYIAWTTRSKGAIFGMVLLALLLSAGYDFVIGSVLLALIAGCACGAFLLTTRQIPVAAVLLIPVLAAGCAWGITGSLWLSGLPLVLLPAMVLMAVATLGDRPRTSVLCFTIAGFLLAVLSAALLLIWKTTGSLDRSSWFEFAELLRNGVTDRLLQQREELLSLFARELGEGQAAQLYAELEAMLTPEAIKTTVAQTFNLLPALITVAAAIVSFFSQMLLTASYRRARLERVITVRSRTLTVSLTAAILYVIAFVLSLILSDSLAYATVQNLSLMLMPLLFLIGLSATLAMAKGSGGARIFVLLILGALFCCYSGGMLYILALWGAYNRIAASIQRKLLEKTGQGGQGPFDSN